MTIGCGYDLGYCTRDELNGDWANKITPQMVRALEGAVGVHGSPAHALARELGHFVSVSWEAAVAVFEERDIPKWIQRVAKALANTDKLSEDCMGALVSLAYNRGASFHLHGSRYEEMRNIAQWMSSQNFSRIPQEIRHMKRLWPGVPGLRARRDHEAALFQQGLTKKG